VKTKLDRYGNEKVQIAAWVKLESYEAFMAAARERGMTLTTMLEQAMIAAVGKHNWVRNQMSRTENFRQKYDRSAPEVTKVCKRHPWWPEGESCPDPDCGKHHCPHCRHDDATKIIHWEAESPAVLREVATVLEARGREALAAKAVKVADALSERLAAKRDALAKQHLASMSAQPVAPAVPNDGSAGFTLA
jgi:hypothetical protein